jgi:hypothetical protein
VDVSPSGHRSRPSCSVADLRALFSAQEAMLQPSVVALITNARGIERTNWLRPNRSSTVSNCSKEYERTLRQTLEKFNPMQLVLEDTRSRHSS